MEDFDEDVWKIVTELGQEERHFNAVLHHYRILASSWLLAMFGGVGFALAAEVLSVPPELIILLLGLACAIGITQLWNLDIRVYHQLLDSCFVQGLELERRHPWLPRLRSSMMASQEAGSTAEDTAPETSPPTPEGYSLGSPGSISSATAYPCWSPWPAPSSCSGAPSRCPRRCWSGWPW